MARRTPTVAAAALAAAVAVVLLCGVATAPTRVAAAMVAPRTARPTAAASVDTDHDTNGTLPLLARTRRPWSLRAPDDDGPAAAAVASAADPAASVDTDHDTNSTLPLLV